MVKKKPDLASQSMPYLKHYLLPTHSQPYVTLPAKDMVVDDNVRVDKPMAKAFVVGAA